MVVGKLSSARIIACFAAESVAPMAMIHREQLMAAMRKVSVNDC
jgi:hypothetical protein